MTGYCAFRLPIQVHNVYLMSANESVLPSSVILQEHIVSLAEACQELVTVWPTFDTFVKVV